jgi:hypothetical protein
MIQHQNLGLAESRIEANQEGENASVPRESTIVEARQGRIDTHLRPGG